MPAVLESFQTQIYWESGSALLFQATLPISRFDQLIRVSQTRINFYVTIFLGAIVPQHKYTNELLDELYINAVFYGFSLLVTVLIQTIKGQLDLYHAIFMIHLLSCLTIFQYYGMSYVPMTIYSALIRDEDTGLSRFFRARRIPFKLRMTILAQLCQDSIIWPPWLFYVWIKVSRFGAQPECNHLVKYVFGFVTIRATVNWLRIFFLIFASFGLLCFLIGLRMFWNLKALFVDSDEVLNVEDDYPTTAKDYFSTFLWVPFQSYSAFLSHDVNTNVLSHPSLAIYGIVTAELIVCGISCLSPSQEACLYKLPQVHRNRPYVQAGENSWGFGQVVSVLLLLPIFIEILAVLKRFTTGVTHRPVAGQTGGQTVVRSNVVTAV